MRPDPLRRDDPFDDSGRASPVPVTSTATAWPTSSWGHSAPTRAAATAQARVTRCSARHPGLRGHAGGPYGALKDTCPISDGGCIRRRVPERVCARRALRSAKGNKRSRPRKARPVKWSRGESNPRAGTAKPGSHKQLRTRESRGGAESGAVGAESAPADPDLQRLIDAWPTLPDAVRAGIAAMVRAAARAQDGD